MPIRVAYRGALRRLLFLNAVDAGDRKKKKKKIKYKRDGAQQTLIAIKREEKNKNVWREKKEKIK